MALPLLKTPEHELNVPSTGEKLKYRPFLVGEEKTLLLALEGGQDKEISEAVMQTVRNCTFGKFDVTKAPMFDIEYIFLKIRTKAAGSKQGIKLLCPDDEKTYVETEIDLDAVEVFFPEGHDNNIKLTDDIGLILDYPSIDMTGDLLNVNADAAWTIIKRCIRQIYDAENVHNRDDMDEKELDEFLSQLDATMFKKIELFFNTTPRLKHTVKVKNPETGVESDVVIEGLQNFFG
jgi:hypothetical protein